MKTLSDQVFIAPYSGRNNIVSICATNKISSSEEIVTIIASTSLKRHQTLELWGITFASILAATRNTKYVCHAANCPLLQVTYR